jgi:antitoxin component of MazEF toxin-antitoxin module
MAEPTVNIVTDVTHFRKGGNSMVITVPVRVTRALKWSRGDALLVRIEGRRVVLEPLVEHMATAITAYEQQNNASR